MDVDTAQAGSGYGLCSATCQQSGDDCIKVPATLDSRFSSMATPSAPTAHLYPPREHLVLVLEDPHHAVLDPQLLHLAFPVPLLLRPLLPPRRRNARLPAQQRICIAPPKKKQETNVSVKNTGEQSHSR